MITSTLSPPRDGFTPAYETWRHGGWYVTNVRYPSGAVGCVSNNYPDKKWRVVCAEMEVTFPSRDAAARAEHLLAGTETIKVARKLFRILARVLA